MRMLLVASLIALAVPVRPERVPHPMPPLANPLLGVWKLVSVSVGGVGDVTQTMEHMDLHITSTQMLVYEKGVAKPDNSSSYTVDWTRQPATIDMFPKKDKPALGVLKIEGNQLTLCFALDGKRPANFGDKSSQIANLHLTRIR